MFLNTLRRFRPETSIFLTAAAIIIGSACAPSDDNNTNPIVNPTGGTVGGTGVGGTTAGTAVQGGTTGGTATAGGTTSGTAAGGTTSGTATAGGTTSGTGTAGGTTSGTGTAGGTTSGTGTAGGTTAGGTTAGGTTAGGTVSGAGDGGVSDGGAGGGTVGGGMVMNFPGKYMGCTSFGKASGTGDTKKCVSWYCNVTLAQMKTAYVAGAGPCANNGPEQTCDNNIATDVGKCARMVKTANPLSSNDELRPKVNDCVRKTDPTNYSTTKLTDACLKCFVDVAQCAGDKCLFECLSEDNADCDKCRLKQGCDQTVFKCGGVPDVF